MRKAMILIVHGSRVSKTADELVDMVKKLNARAGGGVIYFPAFMELQSPCLREAVQQAVGHGIKQIEVLPLFLLAGKHVLNDIPKIVEACRVEFPRVDISLHKHIGAADSFLDAIVNYPNWGRS
jgi:sirohydrochlorin ferrochelatase